MGTNGSLVLNTFDGNYWDKYEGYDLNKNGYGDVPYHPLSLFAVLTENNPAAMLLYRSFMITLLDKSEKVLPSITPDNFIDNKPLMKAFGFMIEIQNLDKKFGKLEVLKNINLSFSKGECIALIGPNGCGKTTLIKSVLGMVFAR